MTTPRTIKVRMPEGRIATCKIVPGSFHLGDPITTCEAIAPDGRLMRLRKKASERYFRVDQIGSHRELSQVDPPTKNFVVIVSYDNMEPMAYGPYTEAEVEAVSKNSGFERDRHVSEWVVRKISPLKTIAQN